ncbi:MAG TPA: beta-propeller fold lactonase family protein [Actinomycetes bacterium]|nr:beta-propeller fold lactonase family protein [Actinomycetes bacterium]
MGRTKPVVGLASALGIAALASGALVSPANASTQAAGAVFSLSNSTTGNAVLSWTRSAKGELVPGPSYATGGLGSGAGLGSQGSVTVSPDRSYLLAVNPGSDEVSAFSIEGTALSLIDTVSSRGDLPISVTVSHDVVYVLNAGAVPNISGYHLSAGALTQIPGSVVDLPSGASGPAEVAFTPAGDRLVVTEKGANRIDTFAVGSDGRASQGVTTPSAGVTPFGFGFNNKGTLLVTDAAGGAAGASTASSYRVNSNGSVSVVSGAVPTTQTAACWLVATNDGKYAFTSNTGSGSISSFAVGNDGSLNLLQAVAASPSGTTIDSAVDVSSKHLFTLDAANDKIDGYTVGSGGSLSKVASTVGLPTASVGLAAI